MRSGFQTLQYRLLPLLFMAVAMAAPAYSADLSAWSGHALLRMNTGAAGAAIAQDAADFPLLLRLDSADFPFSEARPDGADLRFSGPGDALLAHEIERWDPVAKKAEIWIRIPLIKAGTDTGSFRMHWGNPAAAAPAAQPVFDTTGGFRGVWHLSGPAVKNVVGSSEDGNASLSAPAEGVIVGARSVSGKDSGMSVPDAPALRPAGGLTVSLWANAATWSGRNHVLVQKGTPDIQYALYQEGDSLVWAVGGPATVLRVKAALPAAGGWVHLAGTFDGATGRLYVDGLQKASAAVTGGVPGAAASPEPAEHLGIGCRLLNKKAMDAFEGRLDEVAVAGRARPADWIKLAHATQRPGASVLRPPAPVPDTAPPCAERFAVPRDTLVSEGGYVVLAGTADCAAAFSWSVAAGPTLRLLDPDVKALRVRAPRITRDTVLVLRFAARYGETGRTGDVRVTLREAIPDPLFELPSIAAWNGRDSLLLRPTLLNLPSLQAAGAADLRWDWTLANASADTSWRAEGLLLRQAQSSGPLEVGLCLDNGGPAYCRTLIIPVTLPLGLRGRAPATPTAKPAAPSWNAAGRRVPAGKAIPSLRKIRMD